MNLRECLTCGRHYDGAGGWKYCKGCRRKIVRRLEAEGYLETVPKDTARHADDTDAFMRDLAASLIRIAEKNSNRVSHLT